MGILNWTKRKQESAKRTVECPKHGTNGFGIACIHICRAIDSGAQVGFYWCEHEDPHFTRPDVWCTQCEDFKLANPDATVEETQQVCDFQFLCEECWDEAKLKQYDGNG